MRKQFFIGFILGIFVHGIAQSSDMSTIQESLTEVGVKCEINNDGDIVGCFTMLDNGKDYYVLIDKTTFSENEESFRMVHGGLVNRPKASDFTEDQLEWMLVNNGHIKFGGSVILYGTEESIIVVRIPVPINADGKTLRSAMWMCARLLKEADDKIPEVGSSQSKQSKSGKPTDIRSIFDKAKKAKLDGNVNFCGFYLGMTKADADALNAHYELKDGESKFSGDPIYYIHFSLKGVRRITKGGNSYEELVLDVEDHIGPMEIKCKENNDNWAESEQWYEYKTIDGIRVTMSETRLPNAKIDAGLTMVDRDAKRKTSSLGSSPTVKAAAESILASMVDIPGADFKMGKTEVTQAQWEAIMGKNPSEFEGKNNPVERVSWDDCQEFLKWLNSVPEIKTSGLTFRLPTKEEWVLACRAGATDDFCRLADGTEITDDTIDQVAWIEANSDEMTHPVGQKKPNAFGLYDMFGNVMEWTSTVEGIRRVICGCSWDTEYCSGFSDYELFKPSDRNNFSGFRLCASGRAD